MVTLKCRVNRHYLRAGRKNVIFVSAEVETKGPTRKGPPLDVCLAIDCSASMIGGKMRMAKKAALLLAESLRPTDYISVVKFTGKASVVVPRQQVGDGKEVMRKLNKVGTGLKAIVFGAATNLYDGIMKGYEELSTDTGTHARRLILLTDGEPTAGPTGERAFVELSKRVRSKGISITGLGVGKYYNEDLLIAIAEASEGRWHHLVNPDGLPELLREEVLDMKLVELVKPVLQITPISGAKPSNIYRVGEMVSEITDYQKVGGKYAIPLEDVRAGFASRIVFRLHVPPKPEGKLKVAELAVSAPETELTKNVFVESTKNRSRWSIETDPYPRSLLMLSEATTVSKQAVDDVTQVERAQQLVKTVMLDPDAATVVRENAHLMSMGNTVMRVTDTVVKSKLKREDKKKLKHDATVIYAMEEG